MADYHWAIGVILAAIASIISNLGLNFQKLTHLKIQSSGNKNPNSYYKSPLWNFGLILIILGSVADFAALGFGAQSIIAPLGSLTLVSNAFFAPCLLGETISTRDILSTLLIVAGATISVIFASHKDTIYSLRELFGFYEQPRFGLYAIFIMVSMGVLWSAIQYMEALRRQDERSPHYLKLVKYHRFSYAAIAGVVGAQSVLFAKCSAELVMDTLMGNGFLFAYYPTYMVLICLGTTIFLQIKWLNQGLQRFDALYIVPVFQSFWILTSVVGGLVFFGEYREMTTSMSIVFPIGILMTISGVYFLSHRGVGNEDDEEESSSRKNSINASPYMYANEGDDVDELQLPHGEGGVVDQNSEPLIDGVEIGDPLLTQRHKSHHPHHHHYRRFDSRVGFMGKDSPAGFLPSRAMTLSNTMRSEESMDSSNAIKFDTDFGGDDGL